MELYLNILNKYSEIIKDLENNSRELYQRTNYYSRKYRGDRLNDVSILFEYGSYGPTAIIVYIKNVTGCIKSRLTLSSDRRQIKSYEILTLTIQDTNE